ncbi:MAG: SDR family oxidoreductase [Thermoguttaceae bacterium]
MNHRSLMRALGALGAAIAVRAAVRAARSYSFHGKIALVTGGSRGLGLLIARELARQGAQVAICGRDDEALQRATAQARADGQELSPFTCDLTRRDRVEQMVETLIGRSGRIDVLVNNAGIIQVGPVQEMTLADYEQAMAVHLWGPLYAINAVLPQMLARRQGRIVNVSSIGGKISVPHLLPYCASKFALVGLSEGLHAELAKDGVLVTTVCPGLMRTGSPRHALFKGRHRLEYAWFALSDSLPLVSIDARRAARRIVAACRRGDAEVMVSGAARAASAVHGLFPGATSRALALADRLLPGPGGVGGQAVAGRDSRPRWLPSLLTRLTDRAAEENNEIS